MVTAATAATTTLLAAMAILRDVMCGWQRRCALLRPLGRAASACAGGCDVHMCKCVCNVPVIERLGEAESARMRRQATSFATVDSGRVRCTRRSRDGFASKFMMTDDLSFPLTLRIHSCTVTRIADGPPSVFFALYSPTGGIPPRTWVDGLLSWLFVRPAGQTSQTLPCHSARRSYAACPGALPGRSYDARPAIALASLPPTCLCMIQKH